MKRYAYQAMPQTNGRTHYRVFHVHSDNRIATCWVEDNAKLIVEALNHMLDTKFAGQDIKDEPPAPNSQRHKRRH